MQYSQEKFQLQSMLYFQEALLLENVQSELIDVIDTGNVM